MDQKTLAYLNLRAILGSIPRLCEMVPEAKKLIEGKNVSIGFDVKGGPAGTLVFENGACKFVDGVDNCDVKLPFSSPEKFNGLIDGTTTPIPSKGFTKIPFLLNQFTKLTDILSSYLQPEPSALKDEKFFNTSTILMFHLIVEALAQVGNEDEVGQASASYIKDGATKLAIGGGPAASIRCRNHKLTADHDDPGDNYTAQMTFGDMKIARDLFDGNINAMAAVGQGKVRVGGMISDVDNVNRILDRVALYLG